MRIGLARLAGVLWAAAWLTGCGAVTGNAPNQTATTPSTILTQDLRMHHATSRRGSGLGSQARLNTPYGQLPRRFEANQGQTNQEVKFLSRGQGYCLFLTDHEAVLMLRGSQPSVVSRQLPKAFNDGQRLPSHTRELSGLLKPPAPYDLQSPIRQLTDNHPSAVETVVPDAALRMKLVGANPTTNVVGLDELPGKSNYFIGNDPKKWRTNVPNFARVRYKDVYPGVDLIYYGNQRQLEYDFVVSPGADPRAIRLRLAGAQGMEIDRKTGDLLIQAGNGSIHFKKPLVYQMASGNGKRTTDKTFVDGHYQLTREEVTFEIPSYDKTRPLIIDPVLSYATYLGGTGQDAAYGIAVDSNGNDYVAGSTTFPDFPITAGSFQTSFKGGVQGDAFISKLSADGSTLLYSTFLGGSGPYQGNGATGIAVDNSGSAYVTGVTSAVDFPTVNPFQGPVNGGGAGVFVTKLNPTGSALVYSTYLGGLINGYANGIAVSSSGNAYVTGYTTSPDFPTTAGSFQPIVPPPTGSQYDAFVSEFTANGSALVYSTYLTGSGGSRGNGIAVDSAGSAYITGVAFSSDFPRAGSLQFPCGGAFITKLSPDGSTLAYSTCLGTGSGGAIAVDSSGAAYATGTTQVNGGGSFPTTPGAFQTSPLGFENAFVTKLDSAGSALEYSTYLSGGYVNFGEFFGDQSGTAIVVDASGDAYVGGWTWNAPNFPVANPIQSTNYNTGCSGNENSTGSCGRAFITEFNPTGSALLFSTFFGGSLNQGATGIALDSVGNIYFAGETTSTDLPTLGALQPAFAGGMSDAFVAKIAAADSPAVSLSPIGLTFSDQAISTSASAQTITLRNMGSGSLTISNIQASGDYAQTNTCGSSVAGGSNCSISVTFTPVVTGTRTGSLTITDNASGSPHTLALTGTGVDPAAGIILSPTSLTFPSLLPGSTSASKSATLTSNGTAPVTVYSIAASGDFAQTNTCGASLAPAESCTISVTFHPTATGIRNGTITITDDAPGTPRTLTLAGEGADFSVSAAAPAAASVAAGQTATYMLSVIPVGGFNQTVALACSGAPSLSTCSISPSSVTPDGTNPATATITVTTTARSLAAPEPHAGPSTTGGNDVRLSPLWLLALATLSVPAAIRRRRAALSLALTMLFLLSWAACGGGSSNNGGGHPGTPAGTYALTISGTATSSSGNLSHSITVTLNVN
jgi:hypothetical protein